MLEFDPIGCVSDQDFVTVAANFLALLERLPNLRELRLTWHATCEMDPVQKLSKLNNIERLSLLGVHFGIPSTLEVLRVDLQDHALIPRALWSSRTPVVAHWGRWSPIGPHVLNTLPVQHATFTMDTPECFQHEEDVADRLRDLFDVSLHCLTLRTAILPLRLHPNHHDEQGYGVAVKETCRDWVVALEDCGVRVVWMRPLPNGMDDWVDWDRLLPDLSVLREV
ncbi:hypothetical protein JCM3770_002359 [Rhodotorula araucariae]